MTKPMPMRAFFLCLLFTHILIARPALAGFPDDFSDVTWIDPNISSWPITSVLDVNVSGASLIVNHSKTNSWPASAIIGNSERCCNTSVWVFAKLGGRWYASTFEYLRPGQNVKQAKTVSGTYIKRPPFLASGFNWKPSTGEVLGFMVSGLARFSLSNVNIAERSGVFLYRWNVGPIGLVDPGGTPTVIEEDPVIMAPINSLILSD